MSPSDLVPIPGFADPVSSLSHLLGAVVAAIAGVPLIRRGIRVRENPHRERHALRVLSLVLFVVSAVLLLSMSGVYHLLPHDIAARAVLQRLDHAAIFVLIAGTATPVYAIMFRGWLRWGALASLWILAVLGVTLKSIYFASLPQNLGVIMYVVLGWLAGTSIAIIARRYSVAFVLPLLLGGVIYTLGAVIEIAEPRPLMRAVFRSHELFHFAVLGGLTWQWCFIWRIAAMELDDPASAPARRVPKVEIRRQATEPASTTSDRTGS